MSYELRTHPELILSGGGSAAKIYVNSFLGQKNFFSFPNILLGSTREFWMLWKIQEVN
jgi:hypothetical protein